MLEFNDIVFTGSGNELMDPLVTQSVDQRNLERKGKNATDLIGIANKTPLNDDERFGSVNGVNELPTINENGTYEEMTSTVGPKKGFEVVSYGEKITSSRLFGRWLMASKTLVGATDTIRKEFLNTASKTRNLLMAAEKSIDIEATKLLTSGFTVSAATGPGSATPKGLSLFNASHTIYAEGHTTFSNLESGALTAITLTAAIKKHISIRLENGSRVKQPRVEGYTLLVSPDGEENARSILNDGSKFAADGNNSEKRNVFMFEGFRVKLEILEEVGNYDRNGVQIGTAVMWFVLNKPALVEAKAAKLIRLTNATVDSYMSNETKQSVIDITEDFTVDHFWLEYFVVGSTGA